jgi:hypothetical protein
MSKTVGYYFVLFSMLHFINSRCWRPFYDLSDPLIHIPNTVFHLLLNPYSAHHRTSVCHQNHEVGLPVSLMLLSRCQGRCFSDLTKESGLLSQMYCKNANSDSNRRKFQPQYFIQVRYISYLRIICLASFIILELHIFAGVPARIRWRHCELCWPNSGRTLSIRMN